MSTPISMPSRSMSAWAKAAEASSVCPMSSVEKLKSSVERVSSRTSWSSREKLEEDLLEVELWAFLTRTAGGASL